MSGSGRPLRFLAVVLTAWVGVRILLSWPEDVVTHRVRLAGPTALPVAPRHPAVLRPTSVELVGPAQPMLATFTRPAAIVPFPVEQGVAPASVSEMPPTVADPTVERPPMAPLPIAAMPPRSRTTVSWWAMARPGAATGGPVQLGGGQAGVRVRIPVAANGRIALATRLAAPLAGQGREAAVGIEWRPVGGIAMVLERRIALDRSGSGTGLGMIAGFDRRDVLAGFDLEAYGQAGAVARDGIEPYADGAVRGVAPVATMRGAVVRLGLGGWGGAQRGAARLDIGPSMTVTVPVGQDSSMRLSVDWRQRVAGNAAPGSGPAVTLGGDF